VGSEIVPVLGTLSAAAIVGVLFPGRREGEDIVCFVFAASLFSTLGPFRVSSSFPFLYIFNVSPFGAGLSELRQGILDKFSHGPQPVDPLF